MSLIWYYLPQNIDYEITLYNETSISDDPIECKLDLKLQRYLLMPNRIIGTISLNENKYGSYYGYINNNGQEIIIIPYEPLLIKNLQKKLTINPYIGIAFIDEYNNKTVYLDFVDSEFKCIRIWIKVQEGSSLQSYYGESK